MKYNGIELTEMTSEKWDGKSREMIVWTNASNPAYKDVCHIKTVIGYNPRKLAWVVDDKGLVYWPHCAEIPTEEDVMKLLNDNEKELLELKAENDKLKAKVKALNSSNYQTHCGMHNVIAKLEDKIENLEKENQELKANIKSLKSERYDMASAVSSAVWKELMDRAKNSEGLVNAAMPGFGFNDISDIVLNKILNYKSEDRPAKKTRRMTYKELDEWLKEGKGVCKLFSHLTNKIAYWPSLLDNEVEDGILICAFGNSNFEEPLIKE